MTFHLFLQIFSEILQCYLSWQVHYLVSSICWVWRVTLVAPRIDEYRSSNLNYSSNRVCLTPSALAVGRLLDGVLCCFGVFLDKGTKLLEKGWEEGGVPRTLVLSVLLLVLLLLWLLLLLLLLLLLFLLLLLVLGLSHTAAPGIGARFRRQILLIILIFFIFI